MKFNKILEGVFILLIRSYQLSLSKVLRRWLVCRFYPSCSEYAVLSIKKYGIIKGLRNAIKRLKRCRPDNFETCIDLP